MSIYENVSIIGDGAMATVLAILLCEKNVKVKMWGHDISQLAEIESGRENVKFLAGYRLPDSLIFEADDTRIFSGADLVLSAVPCQFLRSVWTRLKVYYPDNVPIASVTKGIEIETLMTPNEIISEVVGDEVQVAALSGPTIADELARKLPATACAACADKQIAEKIQRTFNAAWLRVYTNPDIVGVELAGAMKNVIAIAAGIVDGVGAGDNAKAALLSRGLAEISRLGLKMGAKPDTFAGLTGLGDLVTTCISPKGRNRSLGERIGKGMSLEQAIGATSSVVEGVGTCKAVNRLAGKLGIEMPITSAVYSVLFENKPVQKAIEDLMSRELKGEY